MGAIGALGTAIAIGATTHTGGTSNGAGAAQDDQPQITQGTTRTTSRERDDEGDDEGEGRQRQQPANSVPQPQQTAPRNQLAAPGGGGPPQAGSSGS